MQETQGSGQRQLDQYYALRRCTLMSIQPSEVIRNLAESRKLLDEARQDMKVQLSAFLAFHDRIY